MTDGIITRMTAGCLAKELEARIQTDVFASLPASSYRSDIQEAKYKLQELYHYYRRINPCKASAFAKVHRCIYQVYVDAFERLDVMEQHAQPKPVRTPQQPQLSPEELLAAQIVGLRGRILGSDE